jgi:hypothetical protein
MLFQFCLLLFIKFNFFTKYLDTILYNIQVSQNSRIPNSERSREGPSGARKIFRKKFALPEEDTGCLKIIVFRVAGLVGDIFFLFPYLDY